MGQFKYKKIKRLGAGTFGEVWKCENIATGEPVAIKFLTNLDEDSRKRFFREAQLLTICEPCEQIVDIIEYLQEKDSPAIVMEYCPRGSLDDHIKREGPLRWELALWFMREMAKGLRFVHGEGGFHRDVKPGNMLIKGLDPSRWIVKLSDFGLGRDPGLTTKMTYGPGGTLPYMAPELFQPSPQFSASCDIYALGVSYVHMVTATPDRQLASSMFFEPAVKDLMDTMLATDPRIRPTASKVISQINAILAEVRTRNDRLPPQKKIAAQRDLSDVVVGGLVVAGLVGLIVALFGGND